MRNEILNNEILFMDGCAFGVVMKYDLGEVWNVNI